MWLTQCTGPITRIEDGSITKKQKFGTLKSSNVALSQCVFCIRRYLRQTWIMLLLLLCLLRWKCWWSVIIIPFNWSTLACIKIVIHTHVKDRNWKITIDDHNVDMIYFVWFVCMILLLRRNVHKSFKSLRNLFHCNMVDCYVLLYISNVCRNNMIVFGFLLLVLCVFFASFSLFGTRTACMYDSRSPAYVDNIFLLTMPYINEAHSICEEKEEKQQNWLWTKCTVAVVVLARYECVYYMGYTDNTRTAQCRLLSDRDGLWWLPSYL